MTTTDIHAPLRQLFAELVEGAPPRGAFMLNAGDIGLLRGNGTDGWLNCATSRAAIRA